MENFAVIGFIVIVALVFALVPLLSIWALNTLFALNIAYSLETWASALILTSIISGKRIEATSKAK
jgi:hypothetical protein